MPYSVCKMQLPYRWRPELWALPSPVPAVMEQSWPVPSPCFYVQRRDRQIAWFVIVARALARWICTGCSCRGLLRSIA